MTSENGNVDVRILQARFAKLVEEQATLKKHGGEGGDIPYIGRMVEPPTREEIDAKLAAVEARTETRFVELSGKLDRIGDSISSLSGEVTAVRSDNKFTRLTIIIAVVGSVIAGLAALWATQSNLLSAFTAGLALHDATRPPPK